jgi:hypothetical protein
MTRRVVAIAAILIGGYLLYRFAWTAARAQWIACANQAKLESAIPPPDSVTYSQSPSLIADLKSDPLYDVYGQGNRTVPAVYRWSPWLTDPDRPGAGDRHTLYPLGIMRVPGHELRMVFLGAWSQLSPPDKQQASVPAYSISSRATLWLGTRDRQLHFGYPPPKIELDESDELTVYAGKIDPTDTSHVTVDYLLNGQRGTIDGWLQKDDTMLFYVRSGPAATRPTQGFLSAPSPSSPQ